MYDFNVVIHGQKGYQIIREFLHDYLVQLLPSDHFLLEVALNEAICNSLKNAKPDQTNFHVELKLRVLKKGKLIIRVKDHGPGFSGNHSLTQLRRNKENWWNSDRLYAEGGRGLWIMDHAADFITYNRIGNELMLVKNVCPENPGKMKHLVGT